MEILNIDELTEEKKKVVIKGKEYEITEMSVQNFVETTNAAKVIDENPNAGQGERIEQIKDMISRVIPSCPTEVLDQISLTQLNAIVLFIRGVMKDEIVKAVKGSSEKEEGDEKKAATESIQ